VPELPEVEVVRRGVDAWAVDRTISRVEVRHARAIRRQERDLVADLSGVSFRCASRRGKFLWFPVRDEQHALVVHLGMSGQVLMQPNEFPDEVHLRFRVAFADLGREMRFVDQRTFGWVMSSPLVTDDGGGHVPEVVAHVARDPLDPLFDEAKFLVQLRSKDTEIKRALLDQSLISGIGNIYADEALWRARLHGARSSASLTRPRVKELLNHAREVMSEALDRGGTSFDSLYVNVNGESGYFERSLNAYGREGEPCPRCGGHIRRERFMNRSSFSCSKCQRRPPDRVW
jgi:formamidopyrimidine-DNA glycosylase